MKWAELREQKLMHSIRLSAGQPYDIEGPTFTGQLQVELTGGLDFELTAPHMESKRRGSKVSIRNPQENTEITVEPGYGHSYFPTGTKLFVTLLAASGEGEETRIEFPTFEVGGLRSFPVAVVLPTPERIRIVVAETTSDAMLDEYSAGVRSALRRSIDRDSLPEGRRRDVVVVVDVSSSMPLSTSRAAFEAMCTFAAGVLSTNGGDRVLRLATSSSSTPLEVLPGPEAVRHLATREFPGREVGWSLNLRSLDPEFALVVISDDLPAEVVARGGVAHLLTPRKPVDAQGFTYTVFDEALLNAVQEQDSAALAVPTRAMFDTLTQGEK